MKNVVAIAMDNNSDGHKRVTEGRDFLVTGGSQETHERMAEKLHKMDETLRKKGKNFHDISGTDFEKMAAEHGLRPAECQCGCHRGN